MGSRRGVANSVAFLSLALLGSGQAAAAGGMFVLPVARAWPVTESSGQLFEERIGIALTDAKRVRPLSARDIPERRRREFPADLSDCVTPSCLKRLGETTGAERVLGLKLADEGGRATLFATVFAARSGEITQRREWPGGAGGPELTPRLAAEVAQWAMGQGPSPLPPPPPPVARGPIVEPGLLAFGLAPDQAPSPQAQALLDELGGRLSGRSGFSLALSEAGATHPTHRASVKIEQLNVRDVPHHLERRKLGTLAAALTIVDVASGTVVFAARGEASTSEKAHHKSDAEVMSGLVPEVVGQWIAAFDAQQAGEKIRRRIHP